MTEATDQDLDVSGVPGAIASFDDSAAARQAAEVLMAAGLAGQVAVHVPNTPGEAPSLVRCCGDPASLAALLARQGATSVARTATRYLRRHRVTWDQGAPTPGLGTIYWVPKLASISTAEFHRWWEHEHGPKALRHHMGMWDYAQVSVVGDRSGGSFDGIDGIAVVQWPVPEDLKTRFFDSDDGAQVIRADAASFTDGANTRPVQMTETVLTQPPPPAGGEPLWITDYRQANLRCSPEELWHVAGDFGAIADWWPSGLDRCQTDGQGEGATRRLYMARGSQVVERLTHFRPDEQMFQLEIIEGLGDGLLEYRCRYEVRPTPTGCRLDWQPTALIEASAMAVFATLVDHGWLQVADGLARAVGAGTENP